MGKRIRNINLKQIGNETLAIGYAGENEHTVVRFGCSSVYTDYPNAVVELVIRPPQGSIYLATVTVEDSNVIWEVNAADAKYAGSGRYQLSFTDNGTEIFKSAIGSFTISDSIEPTGDAPDPLQNWMDQAEATAQEIAETAAQSAIEIAGDTQIAAIEEAGQDVLDSIPADYTALSNQVSNLNSAITALESIEESIPFTITDAGKAVSYSTGDNVSISTASVTDYIDISRYSELRYKNIGNTATSASFGMAFYDSEKQYITGIAAKPYMEESGYVPWPTYASVPSNAKYARFTIFSDTAAKGFFELYGRTKVYKETSAKLIEKRVFSDPHYTEGTIGNSNGRQSSATGTFRSQYFIAGEDCLVTMTANAGLLVSMFKYASPSQDDFRQLVYFKQKDSYSFWVEAGMAYRYNVASADGSSLVSVTDDDVIFVCETSNRFYWGSAEPKRFHVKINLNWPNVDSTARDTGETDTETDVMCLVRLPSNYTSVGKPVPLIMFCHGASSQITDDLWYSTSSWFSLMINAFVDAGYAIFDVNNTRNAAGGFPDWGSLPLMSAYIKAWDYIRKNYNVEEKLYLLSDSMGTCANLNMMKWYGASVVTSLMTAPRPVCKARYEAMTGTDKTNFETSFGITSGEWEDRLNGFNHYENIVTINNTPYVFERFPPVKVMVGIDDTGFLAETRAYYKALANSGNYVNYREVADADHAVMSFLENPALRAEAVAWFEKFRYQII